MNAPRLALFALLLFPASAMAASEEYILGRAVETALERNFSVAAARAEHQAAASATNASRSAFGPVFKTGYGLERRQHDRSPLGQSQDRELYAWSISLTQNVFAGFADLSAFQRAALAEESAEAGIAKARVDLANMVQEHFFTYLRAKQDVISARDSRDRLLSQLASSKAFYQVGVSPRLDVLQAEVDVSTAESALLVAENALETERVRLNTLLVLPKDADVEYTGDFVFTPFTLSMDACLDRAYRSRPDLLIAEKAVEIAGKDIRIAQSAFYPQISAQAMWSTSGDDWSAAGSYTRPVRFSEWNIGLSAEWTFFEWGRTWFQVQQARHTQAKIRADADNLRQEIIFSIQERLLALREAAQRIQVAKKAVEQAAEAYRMADARYRSHVGTMTDVLDAQAKLSYAEAALAGAQADYSIALSRICAAMGLINPRLEAL
jgi:outer membrane protein